MTPLPGALGGDTLVAWRLDHQRFSQTWDSGEGAYLAGGRWNSKGARAVYCALDPATAIIEVAVHKGFRALDTVPHVLTSMTVREPGAAHVVQPEEVPNPNWLRPGIPSAGQREFGDMLLARHAFIVLPSVVSTQSWNLIFVAAQVKDQYAVASQGRFALDTRLNPPE